MRCGARCKPRISGIGVHVRFVSSSNTNTATNTKWPSLRRSI